MGELMAAETLDAFRSRITYDAHKRLRELDESLINTPDYMGLAYFWSFAFRHELRDATTDVRRKVHTAFRTAGLAVDENTPQHRQIVEALTRCAT